MSQENTFDCLRNRNGHVQLPDIDDKYFNPARIVNKEFRLAAVRNKSYIMQIPKSRGNCGEATKIQVCFEEELNGTTGEDYDVMEFSLHECNDVNCYTIAFFSMKSSQIDSAADCAMSDSNRVCCPSLNITNEKFKKVVNKLIGIAPFGSVSLYRYSQLKIKTCCRNIHNFNFTRNKVVIQKCHCNNIALFRVLTGVCKILEHDLKEKTFEFSNL